MERLTFDPRVVTGAHLLVYEPHEKVDKYRPRTRLRVRIGRIHIASWENWDEHGAIAQVQFFVLGGKKEVERYAGRYSLEVIEELTS